MSGIVNGTGTGEAGNGGTTGERCLVLSPELRGRAHGARNAEARLAEASGLALAIGLAVVHSETVRIAEPRPATLIGSGQVERFGALIEGIAGFGAPVAITASMLAGLGFAPIMAATLALVANTTPVAFGSLGIPITTLGGLLAPLLERDVQSTTSALSAVAGRHDLKAPASLDPVGLEVVVVDREDPADGFAARHVNERRVGEVHRTVAVARHQRATVR